MGEDTAEDQACKQAEYGPNPAFLGISPATTNHFKIPSRSLEALGWGAAMRVFKN